jgi:hypothetical protein
VDVKDFLRHARREGKISGFVIGCRKVEEANEQQSTLGLTIGGE